MTCWDYGWVAFYDAFARMGITKPKFVQYRDLMRDSNIFMSIQLKRFCIFCEMPSNVSREGIDLHSINGKAIQWRDGWGFYSIFGVRFPKALYEKVTKKNVTAKTILEIENIDQRTAALRLIGPEKLLESVKADLLHSSKRGNQLYKIPKDKLKTPEDVYALKYRDINTPRVYVSFVPLNADELDTSGLDPVQKELFDAKWKGKPVAASMDADSCMAFKHLMSPLEYSSLTNEC